MQAGQVGTKLGSKDLPPGRYRLAQVLVALYGHMDMPSLRRAAQHLATKGYTKDPSELSRYFNGERLPPEGFVQRLYETAVEEAGVAAVGLTWEQVQEAHAGAEPSLCQTCPKLRRENRTLKGRLKKLRADKAGLESALAAAKERQAFLPVPSPTGDRQERARDVAAACQIIHRVEELQTRGEEGAAFDWVRETAELLTPAESAATLVLLRQQQEEQLAEALIQICGRDHPGDKVIRVALELHDYGLSEDAGAVLRAATR
ncbi:hypothetical protein FHS39_002880 [Streptomyces olivoverticillatus]|uniref:Uncharacterized protein n=1 Tax=Streptomyces olivoverticillatus TaxID=66427 RepID=A0A7W7LQG8_9ACTN|nr:hypothetical protein [Streptomyces olivoverticillatus]MBB4893846.1 hypothetical protein [Streptomyces olivoverticillatus]